jgi:ribose/xylose/arabinose/galactoside ABC-type transport system permease subunit
MRDGNLPFAVGLGAAIGAGLALAAINGLIVIGLRVNALIATLGTMIAFRGFGLSLTDGGLIEMPNAIKPLGNTMLGPVFLDTLIALCVLLIIHLAHRRTTLGRQLTAMGNDEDVARRIGIPVQRRTFAVLVLSGLLAAVAGVMYTMQAA